MRSISISTPVFAAIWAARKNGEDDEDAILRRLLEIAPDKLVDTPPTAAASGVHISQYDLHLPEGFSIFRVYKGQEYRAEVSGGRWLLRNNGHHYPSLHKLSWAVVNGRENAWQNWRYRDEKGRDHFIDHLRPEESVRRRQELSLADLDE